MWHRFTIVLATLLMLSGSVSAGVRLELFQSLPHDDLSGVSAIALSPDGAHVYMDAGDPMYYDYVEIFARDAGTGALTFAGQYDRLKGPGRDLAFSPGGEHVYFTTGEGPTLHVYSRNATTGMLTFIRSYYYIEASRVAVSPDGAHVYVTLHDGSGAVAVYERNATTGELTEVEVEDEPFGPTPLLEGPGDVVVSPDGAHVYATAGGTPDQSGIAVFTRDAGTGELTHVQSVTSGAIEELYAAFALVISPDGANVYVATDPLEGPLVGFSRDSGTGMLTPIQVVVNEKEGVYGLRNLGSISMSADGEHLYVSGDRGPIIFTRDASTGLLTFRHGVRNDASGRLAAAPDGPHVYAAGHDAFGSSMLAYTTEPFCPSTPAEGCRQAGRSILSVKDSTDPRGDKLVYKWLKGDQTDFADLGEPRMNGTTSYRMCLYTEGVSGQELSMEQNAPAASYCRTSDYNCWDMLGSWPDFKGFKYKDSYRNPDGIQKLLLKTGAAGKAKIILVSRGELLPSLPTVPVGLPITVQVHNADGVCWTSTFSPADVKQAPGDPAKLKGVAR